MRAASENLTTISQQETKSNIETYKLLVESLERDLKFMKEHKEESIEKEKAKFITQIAMVREEYKNKVPELKKATKEAFKEEIAQLQFQIEILQKNLNKEISNHTKTKNQMDTFNSMTTLVELSFTHSAG